MLRVELTETYRGEEIHPRYQVYCNADKNNSKISQRLVYTRIFKATTKKRYSDTTIQRYTETEPELEPCINYANYCLQSPRETSVIICMYVCKTLFQHAIFVNYLHQLVSTKGVLCTLNLKYITRHTLIKLLITNIS